MIHRINYDTNLLKWEQLICSQMVKNSRDKPWLNRKFKQGFLVFIFTWILSLLYNLTKAAPINRSQSASKELNIDSAIGFLVNFGYIPKVNWASSSLISEKYLRDSIKVMQRFGNIPQTGLLDNATIELMKRKRCGVPDILSPNDQFVVRRSKRYIIQGSKWPTNNISWSVKIWPSNLDIHSTLTDLDKAFNVWSKNTVLKFTHNPNVNEADIIISFFKGKHGDSYPFDGPGGILAHAFFPGNDIGGDVHFDDEEQWAQSDNNDHEEFVGLFDVAAHELGHSFGLKHSNVDGSLMFPYYNKLPPNFVLPEDDSRGILQIYEKNILVNQESFTPEETNPTTFFPKTKTESSKTFKDFDIPITCETHFDAISSIRGETFFFKGKYFWRIDANKKLERNYPIEITYFWRDLPHNLTKIDAVYERPIDKKIIFFIGQEFWAFTANTVDFGFPKPISILGLPSNLTHIDAATIWGHNGKTYFFSGNKYWRFNEIKGKIDLDYPRNIAVWEGVPSNIDAAFQWHRNGINYFFKDDKFWEFNNRKMATFKSSPKKSTKFWFSTFCRNYSTNENEKDFIYDKANNPNISYASYACDDFHNFSFLFLFSLFWIIIIIQWHRV